MFELKTLSELVFSRLKIVAFDTKNLSKNRKKLRNGFEEPAAKSGEFGGKHVKLAGLKVNFLQLFIKHQ